MSTLNKVMISPHIHSGKSTSGIMRDVIIALIPAVIAGTYIFGFRALLTIGVCILSCVLFEAIFNLITHKLQTISDLSAAVTGLLLALNLPANTPLWQCVIGSLFAITGHLFPVFYKFKGGKGVLCGLASLLMVDWRIGVLVVVVFAIVVAICKKVSLGSICACASAPVWCLLLGVMTLHTVYVALAASWLIWCHRSNIKRLLAGTEPKTVIAKRKPR